MFETQIVNPLNNTKLWCPHMFELVSSKWDHHHSLIERFWLFLQVCNFFYILDVRGSKEESIAAKVKEKLRTEVRTNVRCGSLSVKENTEQVEDSDFIFRVNDKLKLTRSEEQLRSTNL